MPARLAALLCLAVPLASHALCTSDGVPATAAVLERFIDAGCAGCWSDPATPRPGRGTLVLDWVVPGSLGEQAPLSAVALPEAAERLQHLGRPLQPARIEAVTTRTAGASARVRLAQGQSFNDYVGTSIALEAPGSERWSAWLLLVEELPAGTEGSPVARNLVRNVFRPDWARPGPAPVPRLAESRSMQIHAGARPERLRLVALLEDGRGRMRAIRRTACGG